MKYFVVKDNLNLTYNVVKKMDSPHRPHQEDYYLVHGPDIDLKYAKAELVNDKIVVSKDQVLEDVENTKLIASKQALKRVRNISWPDISTASDRKNVLKDYQKVILHLARMLKDQ